MIPDCLFGANVIIDLMNSPFFTVLKELCRNKPNILTLRYLFTGKSNPDTYILFDMI